MYSLLGLMFFFFFKQKTAYEMRISDWSSDVCSSDLLVEPDRHIGRAIRRRTRQRERQKGRFNHSHKRKSPASSQRTRPRHRCSGSSRPHRARARATRLARSEEHTSELQSLMRISYAVFCLQKKTQHKTTRTQ